MHASIPAHVGYLGDGNEIPAHWEGLGSVDQFPAIITRRRYSRVALCLNASERHLLPEFVATAFAAGIPVWLPLAYVEQHTGPDGTLAVSAKRVLDLVVSVAAVVLFSPIIVGTAMAIAVVDGFPVLFTQLRAGHGGSPFVIVKFRTMALGAEAMRSEMREMNEITGDASFKLSDDPRVTRLGRVLRKLSLDELPQLWNVLRGEMSLVGPRPHPYDDVAGYAPWQFRRLAVKPGITGLWQVELRGDTNFDNWVRKDLEYIDRWSLWRDFILLVRTVRAVLRGTGK